MTCKSRCHTKRCAGHCKCIGVEGNTVGAGPSAAEARFTQLYARFYSPIRAYCNRRVLPDAVDDAVAEAFLTMWRRITRYRGRRSRPRVAVHRCLPRDRAPAAQCHAPQPSPVAAANRRVTVHGGRRRHRTRRCQLAARTRRHVAASTACCGEVVGVGGAVVGGDVLVGDVDGVVSEVDGSADASRRASKAPRATPMTATATPAVTAMVARRLCCVGGGGGGNVLIFVPVNRAGLR